MGVFDHLRCECPLPPPGGGEPFVNADLVYQTKDLFDPSMGHYAVTRDGRLTIDESAAGEWKPENRAQIQASLDSFHGTVVFGRRDEDRKQEPLRFVEYRATFTHGVCDGIVLHRVHEESRQAAAGPPRSIAESLAHCDEVRQAEQSVTATLAQLRMALSTLSPDRVEAHARDLCTRAQTLCEAAGVLHDRAVALHRTVAAGSRAGTETNA